MLPDDPENKRWIQVKKAIKHYGGVKTCKLASSDILEASHSDVNLKTNPFICKNDLTSTNMLYKSIHTNVNHNLIYFLFSKFIII